MNSYCRLLSKILLTLRINRKRVNKELIHLKNFTEHILANGPTSHKQTLENTNKKMEKRHQRKKGVKSIFTNAY